ncbi:MAG: ribonuclease III [Clostridiales bacterium]|nr:ribonuclease III [Clostridiales bacterium]
MEESVEKQNGLYSSITEYFHIKDVDIHTYSPLTLAYIGDGIYDLVIRSLVVGQGNTRVNQLHHHTSHLVKAHSQSEMMSYLLPELTPEEEDYYRRGRNAKSPTMAKNATVADYRRATGFEALMGYLYLTDQTDRLLYLVNLGLDRLKRDEMKTPKEDETNGNT